MVCIVNEFNGFYMMGKLFLNKVPISRDRSLFIPTKNIRKLLASDILMFSGSIIERDLWYEMR